MLDPHWDKSANRLSYCSHWFVTMSVIALMFASLEDTLEIDGRVLSWFLCLTTVGIAGLVVWLEITYSEDNEDGEAGGAEATVEGEGGSRSGSRSGRGGGTGGGSSGRGGGGGRSGRSEGGGVDRHGLGNAGGASRSPQTGGGAGGGSSGRGASDSDNGPTAQSMLQSKGALQSKGKTNTGGFGRQNLAKRKVAPAPDLRGASEPDQPSG